MKLRENGMPEEAYWETLFDVPFILERLGIDARLENVVELGCGYGTFTLPVARRISGVIETVDMEPAMLGMLPTANVLKAMNRSLRPCGSGG